MGILAALGKRKDSWRDDTGGSGSGRRSNVVLGFRWKVARAGDYKRDVWVVGDRRNWRKLDL